MQKYAPMNASTLFLKLREKGLIEEGSEVEKNTPLAQEQWPFYLHVILFFGAGIAAIFVTSMFIVLDLIDFETPCSLMLWGLLFVSSALIIYRILTPRHTLKYMFFTQLSLVFMIVGKMFVAFGLFSYFDAFWGVPLGLFMLTLATYYLYPIALDRFTSSSLVLLTTIPALLYFKGGDVNLLIFFMYSFVLLQLILLGMLLSHPKCTFTYEPLVYALVLSLGVSISTFSPSDSLIQLLDVHIPTYTSIPLLLLSFSAFNIMFIAALIILMLWLAGDWRKIFTKPFIIITLGIIVLGLITVSGILFSLGILILAHARRERLLTFFGLCFLSIFFFNYYHFLPLSLMEKSIILALTGLMLLLGRYFIMRQTWYTNDLADNTTKQEVLK